MRASLLALGTFLMFSTGTALASDEAPAWWGQVAETVGEQRPETATDPSENAPLPIGLNAPSNLDTSDVTATTAMLHWMDNSTREWGVEMYRMDPVAARRDGVITWHLVSDIDERREVNVESTGMRSDLDFDLTPQTDYCYRLRAYVGFDKSEVSDFSGLTCVFTN